MALISIRKTAAIEPSPTDTVSLYVDAADNHLKQIDENGNIIDLTDGSATSSPNAASLVNTTKAALVTLLGGGLANIKATYRITDAADGIIRVTAKTASLLTATAMKEGSDDGAGTVTQGEWGNYDLDADVFTSSSATSGTWTPTISGIVGAATVEVIGTSHYFRIGNMVVDTCEINVIFDTGQSMDTFFVDMAIPPASNFANAVQVLPIQSFKSPSSDVDTITIRSQNGAKTTQVEMLMNGTALDCTFTVQRTYSAV